MRRLALLLPMVLAGAAWVALAGALAGGRVEAGEGCAPKVPTEAARALDAVVRALKKADAAGVAALMEPGKTARLSIKLASIKVDNPSATREWVVKQLTDAYFSVVTYDSILEDDKCTRGDEKRLVRGYRIRLKKDGSTTDATLTVAIVCRPVDEKTTGWFLSQLKEE